MRVQVMPGNPLYIKDGWGISFTTTHAWFLTQSCLFIILPPVQATLSPSGSGRVRLTVPERITSGAFGGVQTTLPRGPSQPVCVCVCVCACPVHGLLAFGAEVGLSRTLPRRACRLPIYKKEVIYIKKRRMLTPPRRIYPGSSLPGECVPTDK